jgi:EAL domain-containing protein (putative c-di-GMP-specific phosphodiesterase class I)
MSQGYEILNKVDRSFVHGAGRDASLRTIFEASLGMARQLGMKTVAEGVEDRDDWDFLRAAGCDLAQGWFIAKPMPADALPEWIVGWERRRGELTVTAPRRP